MAKIDFAMTPEGDLDFGAPQTDENGNVLYLHFDLTVTTDQYKNGILGKPMREMAYVIGRDAWKQIIYNRLRTDAPSWYHHPRMGGNLTDLIGEPQTEATGILGVKYIINALTYEGLFTMAQISVRATPINSTEIVFFIDIDIDDGEPYRLPVVFNLDYGLKEV